MNAREWFERGLKEDENSPDAALEDLLLDINEQIATLMEQQELTRSELADRLGRSRAYVTQLLNGKPNLTLKTLVQITLALGARPGVTLAAQPATLDWPVASKKSRGVWVFHPAASEPALALKDVRIRAEKGHLFVACTHVGPPLSRTRRVRVRRFVTEGEAIHALADATPVCQA